MFVKVCLVACVLFAAGYGLPVEEHKVVPIVEQSLNIEPEGRFQWSYESGDGSKAVQSGDLKTVEKDVVVGTHQGTYSYTDPADGKTYSVSYIADENGYQPQGEHLPVAPPVPSYIQKALAYLATLPPPKDQKP